MFMASKSLQITIIGHIKEQPLTINREWLSYLWQVCCNYVLLVNNQTHRTTHGTSSQVGSVCIATEEIQIVCIRAVNVCR